LLELGQLGTEVLADLVLGDGGDLLDATPRLAEPRRGGRQPLGSHHEQRDEA
jgi:hypothetical protein